MTRSLTHIHVVSNNPHQTSVPAGRHGGTLPSPPRDASPFRGASHPAPSGRLAPFRTGSAKPSARPTGGTFTSLRSAPVVRSTWAAFAPCQALPVLSLYQGSRPLLSRIRRRTRFPKVAIIRDRRTVRSCCTTRDYASLPYRLHCRSPPAQGDQGAPSPTHSGSRTSFPPASHTDATPGVTASPHRTRSGEARPSGRGPASALFHASFRGRIPGRYFPVLHPSDVSRSTPLPGPLRPLPFPVHPFSDEMTSQSSEAFWLVISVDLSAVSYVFSRAGSGRTPEPYADVMIRRACKGARTGCYHSSEAL